MMEPAEDDDLDTLPEFDPEDFEPRPFKPPNRKRVAIVLAVLLVLFCAAVLPPLISVNRFRRQIAAMPIAPTANASITTEPFRCLSVRFSASSAISQNAANGGIAPPHWYRQER